jgi:type I restriction enzyme, S subunit
MKEEEKLMPKLRFPEFRDADGWNETQLQKIACPVSDRAVTGDGDNVLSLSGEHGLVLQSDYFGKKVAGDSAERYLKLVRNDFVYNDRTTKASVYGTIKRLSKYDSGIVSPIYKCFRFHSDENPVFWEWYFESGSHEAQLGSLVNEGARAGRFNISISQFLSTSAWRPEESEQQKIVECLSSMDELMAAQARKLDALKTHKTGLMQQLFPREGETQPRLRFPEFQNAGEWEEKTLGSFASFSSGGTPPKDKPEYWNGNIPWISASSMYELVVDKADHYVTPIAIGNGTRIAKKGSILILVRGSMLFKRVPICVAAIDVAFNQDVKALDVDASIDTSFLLYQLSAFQTRIPINETGIGAGKIELEHLKGFELFIPALPEQQRIADCLTSLDDLIAAQSQKLAALKTHKQGLMQQLFPSPEEFDA